MEWVAISSSRGPSRPWDRTGVSCIAGGCFIAEPLEKPQWKDLLINSILFTLFKEDIKCRRKITKRKFKSDCLWAQLLLVSDSLRP